MSDYRTCPITRTCAKRIIEEIRSPATEDAAYRSNPHVADALTIIVNTGMKLKDIVRLRNKDIFIEEDRYQIHSLGNTYSFPVSEELAWDRRHRKLQPFCPVTVREIQHHLKKVVSHLYFTDVQSILALLNFDIQMKNIEPDFLSSTLIPDLSSFYNKFSDLPIGIASRSMDGIKEQLGYLNDIKSELFKYLFNRLCINEFINYELDIIVQESLSSEKEPDNDWLKCHKLLAFKSVQDKYLYYETKKKIPLIKTVSASINKILSLLNELEHYTKHIDSLRGAWDSSKVSGIRKEAEKFRTFLNQDFSVEKPVTFFLPEMDYYAITPESFKMCFILETAAIYDNINILYKILNRSNPTSTRKYISDILKKTIEKRRCVISNNIQRYLYFCENENWLEDLLNSDYDKFLYEPVDVNEMIQIGASDEARTVVLYF